MLVTYDDFLPALNEFGFMLFSGASPLLKLSDLTAPAEWHTEEENTDPWEWKRLLIERREGAYAKIRGGLNMMVSLDWHPVFIAAFSPEETVDERYERGEMSAQDRGLWRLFEERPVWSRHELTEKTGLKKTALERALNGLQQEMLITASAEVQRVTSQFSPVGWRSMEYTRTDVWAPDACAEAALIDRREARERILDRAIQNSPLAGEAAVRRFFRL